MKLIYLFFSLSLSNCLFIHKDTQQTELTGIKQNQSDVDIVYSIRGNKIVSKFTDEEYSSAILFELRKENYFANPKVFSKNEYFFINDPSKYKIYLELENSDNFNNSSLRDLWIISSIFTFGIIPFYSKINYHSNVKIYSKDKKLLKEFEYKNQTDFYIHLFLLPFMIGKQEFNPRKEIFRKTAKEFNLLP